MNDKYVLGIITILYLSIPTLFRMVQISDVEAYELATSARDTLESLEDDYSYLQVTKLKLNLFIAALLIRRKLAFKNDLLLIRSHIASLCKQGNLVQDTHFQGILKSDINFCRAVVTYKAWKAFPNTKNSYSTYQYFIKYLESAKNPTSEY